MLTAIEILLLTPMIALVGGSLLNLSSHPHWFVRGWDFPRVQIIVSGWSLTILYLVWCRLSGGPISVPIWLFVGVAIAMTLWHGFRILPYTAIMPKQVRSTARNRRQDHRSDPACIRLVVSNVEEENDQYEQWRRVIGRTDADIVIVLEVDETWVKAATPLFDRYPHRIIQPQDNWYGIMLLSRLPIEKQRVLFLVEDDIPSIDADIRLDDGAILRVIAVHPRPPEPWQDKDAVARDAELTIWGGELANETRPTIIGGDLNDVAWSATTRLFLRISGMLDPRRGRGFFNTFHARHWYCRFPLDYIFHSPHFTLSKIERLPKVGSDHFPMLIDLRHEPHRRREHDVLETKDGDQDEADLRVKRAKENRDIQGKAVR